MTGRRSSHRADGRVTAHSAALAVLLLGCPTAPPSTSAPTVAGPAYAASVTLDLAAPGRPVNRLVLGSNVQWIDGGDKLLRPETTEFDPGALALARSLAPTVLRYPGGSQGDTYHWRNGVGPAASRRRNELFFKRGAEQPVLFGTAEFLELCRQTGAEPLITVNATTGTATEAAAWVRAVNQGEIKGSDGRSLPKARYWEIDNEPYLRNDARPEFLIAPEEFARRANEFIRAMRRVDSSIVIGIPLRSDTIGALQLPQQVKGFASTVLSQVNERFDFVAVHNAYFPFIWNPLQRRSDVEVFQATMAAPRAVAEDLEHTRALLRRHKPGRPIKLAITEFNALFAGSGGRAGHIATLGGALYVADLLRLFAQSDDVMLANYWSLSDNWYFGAISAQLPASKAPEPRPAYHVLKAYDRVLRGRIVPVRVESPTFDSPEVGLVPAYRGTPLVTALATREGDRVRLILINKDPGRPVDVTVGTGQGGSRGLGTATVQLLTDEYLFHVERGRSAVRFEAPAAPRGPAAADRHVGPGIVHVPPHALAVVEFRTAASGSDR